MVIAEDLVFVFVYCLPLVHVLMPQEIFKRRNAFKRPHLDSGNGLDGR
jgi:hypothetical protein